MNRTCLRLLTVSLAVLAFAAACDDGSSSRTEPDTVVTDTDTDVASTDTATDMVQEDTTPPPPPQPWEPAFEPEVAPTGATFPDTGADHAGRTAWYIDRLSIPEIGDDGATCCVSEGIWSRRWSAEATEPALDNSYAEIADALVSLGWNFRDRLARFVERGEVILVLESSLPEGLDPEAPFAMSWRSATFAVDTVVADAAAGNGELVVDDGVGPVFDPVVVVDGSWRAIAEDDALMMRLPMGHYDVDVPVRSPLLEVRRDAASPGALEGFVHGHLRRDDVVAALNEAVDADPDCACLALPEGESVFYVDDELGMDARCTRDVVSPCFAEQQCQGLIDYDLTSDPFVECYFFTGLFNGVADVDLDGDCVHLDGEARDALCQEAATVALEWHAVPTTLVAPGAP